MDKINPSTYITDTDPVDLAVPVVSDWFLESIQELQATESELAWYLAQGWEVIAGGYTLVNTDGSTITKYRMQRTTLNTKKVLQDLITSYVEAYNTGRELNDQRYDDIVTLYEAMLDKAEDEYIDFEGEDAVYEALIEAIITALGDDFDDYNEVVKTYINNMIARRSDYNDLVATFETATDTRQDTYEGAINDLIKLIEADQTAYEKVIGDLNTTLRTDHTDYKALVGTLTNPTTGVMKADYNSFYSIILGNNGIGKMNQDQEDFSDAMDGVLDDYGVSIRAEINTRFDNKLASEKANLITRGLYNSTIWTSISTGIERERTLSLNDITDKITQQTIGVTQSVYASKTSMRDRVLAAYERLQSALLNVRLQTKEGYDKLHAALRDMQQQVFAGLRDVQENLRNTKNQKLNGENVKFQSGMDVLKVVMAARDQAYARVDAVEAERSRTETRVYELKTSMHNQILAARDRLQAILHDSTDKGLTSRNLIIQALNNFMERRTDSYPDLDQLTKLAGLLGAGDTSGFIAP